MLDFSEESKRLVSTFLTYRNDIDIYTEDESKDKEFYKFLFKKILNKTISINDVTPLGCKDNVIKRCIEEPSNGRKKLFIVDGDINIIHGLDIPILPNLFVLDAYCIENLLLDEETIVNFIYHNCATKPIEEIEMELDFQTWLKPYSESLVKLFLHLALVDLFGGIFRLQNANRFHKIVKGSLEFDPDIVEQETNRIKQEILNDHTEEDFDYNLAELESQWSCDTRSLLTIVSGKDYLIPILLIKAQLFKKSKSLPSLEEIKLSLAHFGRLNRFEPLKSRIESMFDEAA
jgi:hypothetical protein